MSSMKRVLFAVAIAIACSDVTGPSIVVIEGQRPYSNAALFAERWSMMENCSGLRGDLSRVHFYTASRIVYKGTEVRGYWRKADNAIFILESLRDNTTAIEHEETHALLQGGGDHPRQYFIDGPCGNLMLP